MSIDGLLMTVISACPVFKSESPDSYLGTPFFDFDFSFATFLEIEYRIFNIVSLGDKSRCTLGAISILGFSINTSELIFF